MKRASNARSRGCFAKKLWVSRGRMPKKRHSPYICKLDKVFIFEIGFFYDFLHGFVNVAFFFAAKILQINGLAVFENHVCLFNPGKMIFPDVTGVVDRHGNDGASRFLSDLKTAAVEGEKFVRAGTAAPFGENADGDAGFYFCYCLKDSFHALLDILSVKEKAVQIFHPAGQERDFQHADLCDISCGSGNAHIGYDNIEITSVVADVKDGGVFRDIFFTDHRDGYAGQEQDAAEGPVDNGKRALVFGGPIVLSEEIFYD